MLSDDGCRVSKKCTLSTLRRAYAREKRIFEMMEEHLFDQKWKIISFECSVGIYMDEI